MNTAIPNEYITTIEEYFPNRLYDNTWANANGHTITLSLLATGAAWHILIRNQYTTVTAIHHIDAGTVALAYEIHRCLKATKASLPVCKTIRDELDKHDDYSLSVTSLTAPGGAYKVIVIHVTTGEVILTVEQSAFGEQVITPTPGSQLGEELAAKLTH